MITPIAQTIATLQKYQQWRHNPVGDMPDAQIVGDAIDSAVAHMEKIQALWSRIVELELKMDTVEQDTRERCKAACRALEIRAADMFDDSYNKGVDHCEAAIDALPRGE